MSERTIEELIVSLASDPQTQSIVMALSPYLPVFKRLGMEFYEDVIANAASGNWTRADELMWPKMTDDEREALASNVLNEARDAVDRSFDRETLLKETVLRITMSLLMTLL